MTNRKLKVVKVGFDNANNFVDIVLLSLKQRQEFDIGITTAVKVKKGKKEQIAIVHLQLREFAQDLDVCCVNEKLGKALGLKEGDKVTISKEVTESEYNTYMAETNPLRQIFGG